MYFYIGYGFDVNQVTDPMWVKLVRTYDKTAYDEIVQEMELDKNKKYSLTKRILDLIDKNSKSRGEYLRMVINNNESVIDGVVECFGHYLIFENITFISEEPRAKYITSRGDFVSMISKYISVRKLTFGNVFAGNNHNVINYKLL